MARHYTTRDFFRQIPNLLLARCFERRGERSMIVSNAKRLKTLRI